MGDVFKAISGVILFIVVLFGLTWIFQGQDFFLYKFWAPKYEAVRRETFEQSKAYNQGMIQEIQNMQFEYVKSTQEQKDALAFIILHRVADYDLNKMPYDLRVFVQTLRKERT